MSPIVVSSPGKVLLAGGYLVLDPAYPGVVVSTSSRFYTVIDHGNIPNTIQVVSPQFAQSTWVYNVSTEGDAVKVIPAASSTTDNKFVHLALQNTLAVASELKGTAHVSGILSQGVRLAIVGDNDFYSQRAKLEALGLPRTLDSLKHIPPFNPTGVSLKAVHKTGLGSSAALITSVITSLLIHFSIITPTGLEEALGQDRRLAHNLSQFVHCLAQGKVGSGFDVSAAVFGSQLYTRFGPEVIQQALNRDLFSSAPLLPVISPSNQAWNYKIDPFQLPPLTRLMLADVDAGSDTPSLVGKVLKWRNEKSEEAHALWTSLDGLNQSFAKALTELSALYTKVPESYTRAVKYISSLQPIQWLANPNKRPEEVEIIQAFQRAQHIALDIRAKMREMGEAAGVPIEPPGQTALLDTCGSIAGVIGGGVPGAGGYDAIWLLVCDPVECSFDERPSERVERTWTSWSNMTLTPLSATESVEKGVRVEELSSVPGLAHIIQQSA